MSVQLQIRVRRDTASAWAAANPVLAAGEIGYETNTQKMKVGDGSTTYGSLPYLSGTGSGVSNLSQLLDVIIASPLDGDVLSYNQTTGKWTNTQKENLVDGGNF